jgi:hypothetical protein
MVAKRPRVPSVEVGVGYSGQHRWNVFVKRCGWGLGVSEESVGNNSILLYRIDQMTFKRKQSPSEVMENAVDRDPVCESRWVLLGWSGASEMLRLRLVENESGGGDGATDRG